DLPEGATIDWIGDNPNKGLAVLAFNGYRLIRAQPFHPTLRYLLPVHVDGPVPFNLLGVWAQNLSGGNYRKHQLGPFRRGLTRYREFLSAGRTIVAGDFNNNLIWDRPGWRINHQKALDGLAEYGLVSAYHAATGEAQGHEQTPTHYWRDRKKDGPTYHIDYVFLPERDVPGLRRCEIGSFEDWCTKGQSDHAPVIIELEPQDLGVS
ncbi:MAG: hypothetical protein AAF439_08215, partial [Pseudomonadota bacterium]